MHLFVEPAGAGALPEERATADIIQEAEDRPRLSLVQLTRLRHLSVNRYRVEGRLPCHTFLARRR